MNSDNLVKMANQIGTFFEAMPDREEAVADIAGHIKRFWEPRMRRALLARLDSHEDAGLDEIVLLAVTRHRGVLE
ncbi:formate dehydrogenase delta subunit [Cupriavidus basilensis OR16]|uniref:Formate dehydrogenase delta subunit n=1 Tax=Cupriavidus basilensis OR16 TaxID=1127483 RepID=H1SI76_9BURK|nr:formate dehydrogenase subunit delta [Cupriavidus basilensis]EHP37777.1 formate dehydrogenase delta subunit [Cupriavidus basilensis OR16]